MRWILLFLFLVSPAAGATSADDLEGALLKDDTKTAKETLAAMHDSFWYREQTNLLSQYENLIDRFEALNNFDISARTYLQKKDVTLRPKAMDDFQQVLALGEKNGGQPYDTSTEVISKLNENIYSANEKYNLINQLINNEKREEQAKILAEQAVAEKIRNEKYEAERAVAEESARIARAEQEAEDRKAETETERRRKICGKDFERIYIGMSKNRLLLCNQLSLAAAKAGNIQVYRDSFGTIITVAEGKVFSWIR